MLEHYFKYPGVLRRLRRGGLGNDLDRIAAYLLDNSYQQASAKAYLSRLGRFSDFVLGSDPGRPISQSVIDSFVAEHTTKASRVGARTAVALTRRIVPERFERRPEVHDPHALLLGSYSDYLREVRGLEAKTREGQLLAARRMLGWWDRHHAGELLSMMTGEHVLALVGHLISQSVNDNTRAGTGSYVRRFLGFLRWADLNDRDLARIVPRTPSYRLAHLPRQLAWEDVRRAIDAIDGTTPTGSRDRAILLLLATTGIRNKELRSLSLEDIRWRDAEVRIRRTKGKRDRTVPLMHEAGEALANYILRARPDCDSRRVFPMYRPPVRPIDASTIISRIVGSALRRADVSPGGPVGAHLIRHSLATRLVSRRTPINEVADLLGHRSMDTTAIYVKVAVPQLAEVPSSISGRHAMSTFSARLGEHVAAYLALRRTLGYSLAKQAAILRELVGYVDAEQYDGPLCRRTVVGFIFSREATANGRAVRYGVVRRFSEYLAIFDPRTEALDPKAFPRNRAIPPPRLLTDDELVRLMAACRAVSPNYPERSRFLTPIVGLLASTGMRSGEALRLDRGDADLIQGILHIRRTKFRKDRLVPVHPTTLTVLRDYARHRDATSPAPDTPAFFISSRGARLSQSGLNSAFRAASSLASLDQGGKRLRPHDLRHRFAVTRLAVWHQERTDVRAMLPLLATYLGHGLYTDTAYYVTAGADLLAMAAERSLAWGQRP